LCSGDESWIKGVSAHDGRHAWATLPFVEEQTSKRCKMLGGWKSIAMSARYAASQKIANKGVVSGK